MPKKANSIRKLVLEVAAANGYSGDEDSNETCDNSVLADDLELVAEVQGSGRAKPQSACAG